MKYIEATHKGMFQHFADSKGLFAGCTICGKRIRDFSKKDLDEHLKECKIRLINSTE